MLPFLKGKTMFAGIDIGSLSCKAVLFDGLKMVEYVIIPTGGLPKKSGAAVFQKALENLGTHAEDVRYAIGTGYGRNILTNVNKTVTEITCCARGASFLWPRVEMVIDIGGQDCKVILVDGDGRAADFITNDKCAAGTGRFFETMAKALDLHIDEMAAMGHDVPPACISSTCAVFAESEIIGLLAIETPMETIVAGINRAIVERVSSLVNRLGDRKNIMFCGGVGKNTGVRRALEKSLKQAVIVPDEPQIVGALGAAILACETYGQA